MLIDGIERKVDDRQHEQCHAKALQELGRAKRPEIAVGGPECPGQPDQCQPDNARRNQQTGVEPRH